MKNIETIPEFIRFVIDLFNDEFDYVIDYIDSSFYFSHVGCYELAKIINHYFKDTQFVLRNDGNHVGIIQNGKVYDVYDGYTIDELKEMGISEDEYNKNISQFQIISKEELDNISFGTGKSIYIEGKDVANGIIDEISNIDSIKVGM